MPFLSHIESELQKINSSEPQVSSIRKGFEQLKKGLQTLKSATPELQSLQIKSIVDQMAILYVAVNLLKEALDQSKSGSRSKFDCLDYLLLLHLENQKLEYNQEFIN